VKYFSQAKQNWDVGNTVKVGWMELEIKAKIPTPGDYMPDKYLLLNCKTEVPYTFTPYYGLEKGWD